MGRKCAFWPGNNGNKFGWDHPENIRRCLQNSIKLNRCKGRLQVITKQSWQPWLRSLRPYGH